MAMKTWTSVAFLAGCAIALAVSAAQAQVIDAQGQLRMPLPLPNAGGRVEGFPERNGMDSAQYERLLRISPAFQRDGLTGDSHGRMNPIDRTFQGPEMYDPRFGR